MLASFRSERSRLDAEGRQLVHASTAIQALIDQGGLALKELLDNAAADPLSSKIALLSLQETIQARLEQTEESTVQSILRSLLAPTQELMRFWERASDYHARAASIAEDMNESRTVGRVRDLLQKMRAEIDGIEGKLSLDEAIKIARWRSAAAPDAHALAQKFLADYSQKKNQSFKDIKMELIELSRLIEVLAGEPQFDHLSDLKDNRIRPSLDRLERQASLLENEFPPSSSLRPERFHVLQSAIFGDGGAADGVHRTVAPFKGGLYSFRQDFLKSWEESEVLERELEKSCLDLKSTNDQLNAVVQQHANSLAQEVEGTLDRNWKKMLLLGGVCLIVLLGIVGLIVGGIRFQVDAIQKARMIAETSLHVTNHLLEEQTASSQAFANLSRQHELILNSAGDGILKLDLEGKITFANKAAAAMLGWGLENLLGKDERDLLHPFREDRSADLREERPFHRALREGKPHSNDHEVFRRGDGTSFAVELNASPIVEQGGVRSGAVFLFRDATLRKKAEEQMSRAAAEMERANRELETAMEKALEAARLKSDFLAMMSHEIRTPMNAIIGMTTLLMDTRLNEEQHDFSETIRVAGETLLQIINDILDFSKMDAGRLSLEEIDFNLQTAVEEVLDILAARAQAKGIELIGSIAPSASGTYSGDPARLRQVLLNLVGNAVKFTSEGEVAVEVAAEDSGAGDALLRFAVRDTGIGIPREASGRLFQPFSQADSSMSRKFGGTGLGLAISKRIVEAMRGEIGCESEVDKGSTFWFTVRLPKAQAETEELACPPILQGKRVWLIQENETYRRCLEAYLRCWRMECVPLRSACEAIERTRAGTSGGTDCDIVLLDAELPGTDGSEIARTLHDDPSLSTVPFILMAPPSRRVILKEIDGIARVSFISKPVRLAQLQKALIAAFSPLAAPGGSPPPAAHPIRRRADEEGSRRRGELHILVAEDNPVNQKVALRILAKFGYKADVVENGVAVLEAVQNTSYSLILMDCQMPEMDGFEATRRIRSREEGSLRIPIVALTANAMAGDRAKCLAAGMDDFLSKPVKPSEMDRMIQKWALRLVTV